MLQRLPVILAVTTASYGLVAQAQGRHSQRDSRARQSVAGAALLLSPAGVLALPGTPHLTALALCRFQCSLVRPLFAPLFAECARDCEGNDKTQ